MIALAYRSKMALTELLRWEPEDIATLLDIIDRENDARKDAAKGR